MHCKIITVALCALSLPASISARPAAPALARRNVHAVNAISHPITLRRRNQRAQIEQAMAEAAAPAEAKPAEEAAAGEKEAAAVEGEVAAGEEENKENEKEIESAFAAAVALEGGDLKQDIVFTPSTVGKFEFEFQNDAADECTVTENAGAAAAAPPAGFEAIEPNSYTVALAVSKGEGLTLSKIDYIFDVASAGLVGKDITQAKVGKFCAEAQAFVIADNLGELEFEAEENEVTLNLNKNVTAEGEWAVFLPLAGVEAAAGLNATDPAVLEQEKLKAEEQKKLEEQQKAQAEQDKAAKEAEKIKAEEEKKAMEQAKLEQEKAVKEAEKVKAEQDKVAKEAEKVKAEQEKLAKEAEKKAMEEQKKMAAEQDKAVKEAEKLAMEQAKAEQDKAAKEAEKLAMEQAKAMEAEKVAEAEAAMKAMDEQKMAMEAEKAAEAEAEKKAMEEQQKMAGEAAAAMPAKVMAY